MESHWSDAIRDSPLNSVMHAWCQKTGEAETWTKWSHTFEFPLWNRWCGKWRAFVAKWQEHSWTPLACRVSGQSQPVQNPGKGLNLPLSSKWRRQGILQDLNQTLDATDVLASVVKERLVKSPMCDSLMIRFLSYQLSTPAQYHFIVLQSLENKFKLHTPPTLNEVYPMGHLGNFSGRCLVRPHNCRVSPGKQAREMSHFDMLLGCTIERNFYATWLLVSNLFKRSFFPFPSEGLSASYGQTEANCTAEYKQGKLKFSALFFAGELIQRLHCRCFFIQL